MASRSAISTRHIAEILAICAEWRRLNAHRFPSPEMVAAKRRAKEIAFLKNLETLRRICGDWRESRPNAAILADTDADPCFPQQSFLARAEENCILQMRLVGGI
jgi:hypothetical protein